MTSSFILKIDSVGPIDTNTALLGCAKTGKAFIIDTPLESAKTILKGIKDLKLEVQAILLTHSHWDHIGDCLCLKEALQVPVFVHPLDAPNLKLPGADQLPCPFLIKGVEPTDFLSDKQHLSLGALSIEVIHTPGHTPGGVCFYLAKEKLLFSGDTLFQGSMGRIDFPTSSPKEMWASLHRLSLLPPETQVFPGHGEPTRIGEESWMANAAEYFSH